MSNNYQVPSFVRRVGCALTAAMIVAGSVATSVEARPGGGGSVGSRGGRTYTAPPSTQTAPGVTTPMQRSTTPQVAPRTPGTIARPAAATPAAAAPRRGFGSLLMGGLLGAGLFGLLSGAGLFGGMSGMAGMLGLLLQIALIGGLVWLGMSFWRNRQQNALAGAPAGGLFGNALNRGPVDMSAASRPLQRTAMNANAASAPMANMSAAGSPATVPLKITGDDFNAFEALLGTIQNAYGAGDRTALSTRVSPEMLSYFNDELADNERRGIRNEVSDAKLLQGDLSESWTEDGKWDYATVAMRYALIDAKVDIKSGRVIDGSRTESQEVTEVWTFLRPRATSAANWRLSAIQQVQ